MTVMTCSDNLIMTSHYLGLGSHMICFHHRNKITITSSHFGFHMSTERLCKGLVHLKAPVKLLDFPSRNLLRGSAQLHRTEP